MTHQEINNAIAEHLKGDLDFCLKYENPDFCNDLNAMHEAIVSSELNTDNALGFKYLETLTEVVGGKPDYQCMALIQATAAQRAEAFLKTLNLWK